jgi:hypothetical protein
LGLLDELAFAFAVRFGFLAFALGDDRVFFGLPDACDLGFDFALGFGRVLVCAMFPPSLVPVAELRLASAGALLIEVSLDLCPLRLLLGDRGLGPALVRPLAMVLDVVVLGLGLNLAELTVMALAASG